MDTIPASTPATILATGRPSPHPVMAPGIYDNLDEDRYHAGPEVSVSALKEFDRAPIAGITPYQGESKALHIGSVFHTLLLTPDLVEQKFHIHTLDRVSEREEKTQVEMRKAAGRIMVKKKDFDTVAAMVDSARKQSSLLRELLGGNIKTEQSFYWVDEETRLPCRARADGVHNDWRALIDAKSCADATEVAFAKAVANHLYHWQAANYLDGYPLAGGFDPQAFIFIGIEKEPPYLVGVYELDNRALDLGREMVRMNLRGWAECAKAGQFPGLKADRPVQLALPHWAYQG